MKDKNIQTKRKVGGKPGLRVLHAKTRRKQRAATATAEELDGDVPSVGVGRALIVILVLHVIAIGAIIAHTHLNKETDYVDSALSNNTGIDNSSNALLFSDEDVKDAADKVAVEPKDSTNLLTDQKPVADEPQADVENDLFDPLSVNKVDSDQLNTPQVIIPEVVEQPKAVIVKPRVRPESMTQVAEKVVVVETPKTVSSSGQVHTVVSGDTFYKIMRTYGVSKDALMEINTISDPSKIRLGQKIKIPTK